jgi:hypothetical protein
MICQGSASANGGSSSVEQPSSQHVWAFDRPSQQPVTPGKLECHAILGRPHAPRVVGLDRIQHWENRDQVLLAPTAPAVLIKRMRDTDEGPLFPQAADRLFWRKSGRNLRLHEGCQDFTVGCHNLLTHYDALRIDFTRSEGASNGIVVSNGKTIYSDLSAVPNYLL